MIDCFFIRFCYFFSSLSHSKSHDYETVPILRILETKDFHKLIPAIGCLFVITCSSALLEVFTESFQIIVRFATSEWKILLKQISYESRESGNPVLAIFVCGSLVAILAFTCPMQNMTFIIAGAQLMAGMLRAFYLLYAPFRPKSMNPKSRFSNALFDSYENDFNSHVFIQILHAYSQKIHRKPTAVLIQETPTNQSLRSPNARVCGFSTRQCHQLALTICQIYPNQFQSTAKTRKKLKRNGFCWVNHHLRSTAPIKK